MINLNKVTLIDKAVEITKEYARGGGSNPLESVLKNTYEELKKLNEDAKNDSGE